jgi:hypothetical protein
MRSLRRDAQSSSQVLQRAGRVYQSTPAFRVDSDIGAARLLGSTGITPLRRYYEPRRRRFVFGRFPGSSGYTTYLAPPISRRDEDGFSSCSACPCHRAAPNHPAGVARRLVSSRHVMLPSPRSSGLGLRNHILSRPPLGSRALRPGDSLAILTMASSVGFIRFVSSTDATQATKVPDFSSGGTVSH